MDYVLAMDTSYYQDNNSTPARPNFQKAFTAGVRISIHRAVFGTTKDEDFDYNWKAAADAGMLRCAYGFLDYRAGRSKVADQGKAFVDALYKDPGELPVQWCDFEQPNAQWPALPTRSTCLNMLTDYFGVVDAGLGRITGFYGNQVSIRSISPVPTKTLARPLWLAGWPTVPAGKTPEEYCKTMNPSPAPWLRWTLWQFSAHGDGRAYGMESGNVDLDFFNGSMTDLLSWIGKPVVQDPTLEEKVDVMWNKLYLPFIQK